MKELHVHQNFNPRYQGIHDPEEPVYEYIAHKVVNDTHIKVGEIIPHPLLVELCEKDNWKVVIS